MVNDSPALKKADVGFAMGSGTEVAKEAGDIVILDDNFKSIEKAILFGRTIYKNIQSFLMFQLTMNIAIILISLILPLFGVEDPITIINMLVYNLIMDTLAGLAFSQIDSQQKYMEEKPKRRDENILTNNMKSFIGFNAVLILIASIIFTKVPLFTNIFNQGNALMGGYFTLLVFASVCSGICILNKGIIDILKTKSFTTIMGIILLFQILITFVGGEIFRTQPLTLIQWIIIACISILFIPLNKLKKSILKEEN